VTSETSGERYMQREKW